jgi:RluA family pseudouridine synthase
MRIDIIYEDEHIIAINKPAHLLSIPDRYNSTKENLKNTLKERFGEIYVVHRLDKETSGIIVFAKTEESHKYLNEQFQEGTAKKIYLAICLHPQESEGTIDNYIAESPHARGTYIVAKKGKRALTEYKVIESFQKYALIELKIATGRTHQIRVHMKHIGAPMLTDSKYGLAPQFMLSEIKRFRKKRDVEERPLMSRTSLHSASLEINHPATGKLMRFLAPLPKDMTATISQLRKIFN